MILSGEINHIHTEQSLQSPDEPFVLNPITTAISGFSGLLIGVSTTLAIIARWYVKFIPLLRKLAPKAFRSDLDEWLENLIYRLILRDERVKNNATKYSLKDILRNTESVVDLIETDPEDILTYLQERSALVLDTSEELNKVYLNNSDITAVEKEAFNLLSQLVDAPQD